MSEKDREVLFGNEAFIIGMLQVLSGGAVVAALAQLEAITKITGSTLFAIFFTAISTTLGLAVLAAYWRHEYKKWDVKAGVSAAQGKDAEANKRSQLAGNALDRMRGAIGWSVGSFLASLAMLVLSVWVFVWLR
jgi:hypothetical protein